MTTERSPVAAATSATGSIYDLGYQAYDGPRLGRRQAIAALFIHSLKASFGIGRGGRAKVIPIGLTALSIIPAIVAIGFQALLGRAAPGQGDIESPIRYDTYYAYVQTLVGMFVAAQAPELLGRDQRYSVLSLYFSRALLRIDYALAKAAALVGAILIVVLSPQVLIFVGLSLSGTDVPAAILENAASLPPVIVEGLAIALLLGAIGLAISAFTPRRAYATAAIIAVFIVPPVVASIVGQLARGEFTRYVVLVSPGDVLEGLNAFLFGRPLESATLTRADLPGELYAATVVLTVAILLAITVRRYMRISA